MNIEFFKLTPLVERDRYHVYIVWADDNASARRACHLEVNLCKQRRAGDNEYKKFGTNEPASIYEQDDTYINETKSKCELIPESEYEVLQIDGNKVEIKFNGEYKALGREKGKAFVLQARK